MNINRFANNIDQTPLHSSGYAEVARKNKIGAYSPQTFNQRLHMERNRTSVGGYHHSMLANGHHRSGQYQRMDVTASPVRPGAEAVNPRGNQVDASAGRQPGRLISDVTRPMPRQNFSEPQTRGYNPYQ
jgi:hypothetical protein